MVGYVKKLEKDGTKLVIVADLRADTP